MNVKELIVNGLILILGSIMLVSPLCLALENDKVDYVAPEVRTTSPVYGVPLITKDPYMSSVELKNDVETKEDVEILEETKIESKKSLGEFKITAYCSCSKCCGKWADGYTYTGTVATEGRTIAVDPDVISLGSVVEINGVEYIAEDVGGSIRGNKIDLYFDSHQDALEWGVQKHDIFLVE